MTAGTVLVTGGTGGIGGAVLRRLLADGHELIATHRSPAAPTDLQGVRFVRCDVTDPEDVDRLLTGIPVVDAVINLVGGFASGPKVHESPPQALTDMLQLNLLPAFLLARAAVPRLLASKGCFVAVSSSAIRKPFAGAAGYLTAKAALVTLIESLDAEYGSQGLRANVLLPGTLDTPANRTAMPEGKTSSWVQPEHFADAIAVLLSPASAAIRGAAIPLAAHP